MLSAKKIFQNKSLLRSVQIFLVCLAVLGGGLLENSKAEAACSILGSYPEANYSFVDGSGNLNSHSYSRTNENVSIEFRGGESYQITDPGLTVLYSSVFADCTTEACGFLTLLKENSTGEYWFLIGEDDFMPNGAGGFTLFCTDVCQAYKDDFIPIISENLIGGIISQSDMGRTIIGGAIGYNEIEVDNGVDRIHFIFSDFMTMFLGTKGWSHNLITGGLAGSFTAALDICDIFPPPACTLTAAPAAIIAGNSSTLTWTTANTATVAVDNGVGSTALNDSESVTPAATTTYTLTATNASGDTATCSAIVAITVPPPLPPPVPDMGHSTDHGNYFKYDKDIKLVFTEGAQFLLKIAGGLALFILVLGGLFYIISGSSPDGQTKAKKIVTYAVIGLAIVLISYVIIIVVENIAV